MGVGENAEGVGETAEESPGWLFSDLQRLIREGVKARHLVLAAYEQRGALVNVVRLDFENSFVTGGRQTARLFGEHSDRVRFI